MTHVYQDHVTKAHLLYGDLYGIPLTRVAWNYASRIFPPAGWQYGRGARPRMPFVEKPRNYPSANLSGSCVIQVWSLPPSLAPTHPLLLPPVFSTSFPPRFRATAIRARVYSRAILSGDWCLNWTAGLPWGKYHRGTIQGRCFCASSSNQWRI